jgi:hypothetical protein
MRRHCDCSASFRGQVGDNRTSNLEEAWTLGWWVSTILIWVSKWIIHQGILSKQAERGPTPEVGGLLRDQGSGFVGPKPLEHSGLSLSLQIWVHVCMWVWIGCNLFSQTMQV